MRGPETDQSLRRARFDRTAGRGPVTASSSEELREAIAREEARVARLEDERRLAQGRLDALRSELAALGARASNRLLPLIPEPARPETSAEKVTLFRQLFRGRDDLYPKLWTNSHDGPQGVRPGLRERVGARHLREAACQVRGVPQSGVPCR